MQAIDVARARGLLASQENHHTQIKKTTSGLDIGSQGFPGIWVSLQWMTTDNCS